MVKRSESKGVLEEFEGTVKDVVFETVEGRRQYHITIDPKDIEIKGPSGMLHEWVPMSPKAKEDDIPQGSVMDRYLTQVEICIREAKTASTVTQAFGLMKGKTFRFQRLKLGKDYDGHAAKDYIVPVARL